MIRLTVDINLDDPITPEREAEMALLVAEYLTNPEGSFITDYGPEAWGGYDGPKVSRVRVSSDHLEQSTDYADPAPENDEDDDLVCIVHLTGDDYESAVDAANERGGSTKTVVAHLAQWDYGDETDGASEVNGRDALAELEALPHQLHEVDHGGLHYWLQIDHGLRFYALYRRPLGQTA